MVIGLTGGMGCGKSTAAEIFASHGFIRLDADAIVRERLLPDPQVISAVRDKFGPEVLNAAGQIDRSKLAARVFTNDEALRWLENLLHPRLLEYWQQTFMARPDRNWVVEVPLLFEKGLQKWFDLTVCVASHSVCQFARLAQRGLTPTLARQRIAKQLPLARKIESADAVLLNDGSLAFLRDQVGLLVSSLPSGR